MIIPDTLGYFLERNNYSKKIEKLPSDCDFNVFRKTRRRLSWTNKTGPEILARINIMSEVTKENFRQENIEVINGLTKHIRKNQK